MWLRTALSNRSRITPAARDLPYDRVPLGEVTMTTADGRIEIPPAATDSAKDRSAVTHPRPAQQGDQPTARAPVSWRRSIQAGRRAHRDETATQIRKLAWHPSLCTVTVNFHSTRFGTDLIPAEDRRKDSQDGTPTRYPDEFRVAALHMEPGSWAFRHVVDVEGNVVGMGRVVGVGGWYFLIAAMATLPAHRGHGIGGAVLDALLKQVHQVAPEDAYVTLTADPPVGRLYESRGFTDVAPDTTGMPPHSRPSQRR